MCVCKYQELSLAASTAALTATTVVTLVTNSSTTPLRLLRASEVLAPSTIVPLGSPCADSCLLSMYQVSPAEMEPASAASFARILKAILIVAASSARPVLCFVLFAVRIASTTECVNVCVCMCGGGGAESGLGAVSWVVLVGGLDKSDFAGIVAWCGVEGTCTHAHTVVLILCLFTCAF